MKGLVSIVIVMGVFLCLTFTYGCADIVIGDNPIVVVDDHMYVFLQDGDELYVNYSEPRGHISIERYYDEGVNILYEEMLTSDLNKLQVLFPNGRVYSFTLYKDENDEIKNYRFVFSNNPDLH